MYGNMVMLIFLILTAIAVAFMNKAKGADMPNDNTQEIKVELTR